MIIIGVVEEQGISPIIRLLKKILINSDSRINLSVIETLERYLFEFSNSILKDYLYELKRNKIDIAIIKVIPELLMKNTYDNIRFDVLVCNNHKNADLINYKKKILDIIDESNIAIINSDHDIISKSSLRKSLCIITCGLNHKSTVTTSSIEECSEEKVLIYCLQRTIKTLDGTEMHPQEFPIKFKKSDSDDIFNILAAVSLALICGIETKIISDISI
jgi:UDP-N-acetylmuramyl pentapeptide synthase